MRNSLGHKIQFCFLFIPNAHTHFDFISLWLVWIAMNMHVMVVAALFTFSNQVMRWNRYIIISRRGCITTGQTGPRTRGGGWWSSHDSFTRSTNNNLVAPLYFRRRIWNLKLFRARAFMAFFLMYDLSDVRWCQRNQKSAYAYTLSMYVCRYIPDEMMPLHVQICTMHVLQHRVCSICI